MEKIECGGCAPPVLVAGSRSRLDEAVEVARLAYEVEVDGQVYSPNVPADAMRAAILASLPVLLGEPVAWMFRAGPECAWQVARSEDEAAASKDVYVRADYLQAEYTAVYAPSLGEGDGR